jgi:hypothetical protein
MQGKKHLALRESRRETESRKEGMPENKHAELFQALLEIVTRKCITQFITIISHHSITKHLHYIT